METLALLACKTDKMLICGRRLKIFTIKFSANKYINDGLEINLITLISLRDFYS